MKRGKIAALAALAVAGLAAYLGLGWVGAGWLLMPERKPLAAWQALAVARGGVPGLRLERGVTEGGVPYLVGTPDPSLGPSPRGRVLRAQLAAAGHPAGKFGEIHGTVVLLHGWGMRKEDLLVPAERFCAAGFRCVMPDLPGHGENPAPAASFGQSPAERLLPRAVLEGAAQRGHFAPRPAALWGLSMGGAVAIEAAAATPDSWDALVVVSSFDALDPVVRGVLDRVGPGLGAMLDPGLALAVRCRGGFPLGGARPGRRAAALRLPTLVVHGTVDDFIPPDNGQRLYRALAASEKRWLPVAGATHHNVLGTPQAVFAEMARWLAR